MSRYGFESPTGFRAFYGFDHALGYWFELWRPGAAAPDLEQSSAFDGLKGSDLAVMLMFLEMVAPVPESHFAACYADLPF